LVFPPEPIDAWKGGYDCGSSRARKLKILAAAWRCRNRCGESWGRSGELRGRGARRGCGAAIESAAGTSDGVSVLPFPDERENG
jgi:hypothetical protein